MESPSTMPSENPASAKDYFDSISLVNINNNHFQIYKKECTTGPVFILHHGKKPI